MAMKELVPLANSHREPDQVKTGGKRKGECRSGAADRMAEVACRLRRIPALSGLRAVTAKSRWYHGEICSRPY